MGKRLVYTIGIMCCISTLTIQAQGYKNPIYQASIQILVYAG